MTEVHAITSAGRSQSAQSHDRTRTYLIMMGIRIAAFVGAFFADGWLRWALVAAAVILPMFAVIIANAGSERRSAPSSYIDERALPAAPQERDAP
ncbi:DUF3099 domain-containing protein [Pseudactinotalea suaedae]|uniref:DUF3099 domain-containing protein n=1 Tax=Pseudactinotalea suaedae TaxID=1524924 RepID=UPI0012E25CF7|nr:DUF3099 domain-containing protein [Pseudactinotalea suaedae]